ncbi:hypothetical protein ACGTN9_18190 [Halobacillus sp. MO56]
MKRIATAFTTLLVIITAAYIYLDTQYLYTPLTFQKDSVTPHDWWDYKRPLTMKFHNISGDYEGYVIEDQKEIKRILTVLKKSETAEGSISNIQAVEAGLTVENKQENLVEILIYTYHWEILKYDAKPYQRTERIDNLLNM